MAHCREFPNLAESCRRIRNCRNPTHRHTMNYVIDRLAENSTWRGIILVVTATGVHLSPELSNAIVTAGLGLVGLINVLRKERAK